MKEEAVTQDNHPTGHGAETAAPGVVDLLGDLT